MVNSAHEDQALHLEAEAAQARNSRRIFEGFSQETPEGDEDPEVEDLWLPDEPWVKAHNRNGLIEYGQQDVADAPCLWPDKIEGAIGRAANHYYYGGDMFDAAAALGHGIGESQAYSDGNKRAALYTTKDFLDHNGYGHVSPHDFDDEEYARHLKGYGVANSSNPPPHYDEMGNEVTPYTLEDTASMFRQRHQDWLRANGYETDTPKTSNILDPIHNELDVRVWLDNKSPAPKLRPEHRQWIIESVNQILDDAGYDGMEDWLSLVFTGSLTTYQYSEDSDCDISLFVDTEVFPEWSRAEMIGIMVDKMDGTPLPGTPFPMQCFVVPPDVAKEDLYKPGMRSGYDLKTDQWIVPPEKNRVHDVEKEMNRAYTLAIENADKMDRLLKYEPDKAIQFWHQIHNRRRNDMRKGKGDYADSNITYKLLANRGYFERISDISGEYIA